MVYVSDSDTEGDNVMATYEGAKGVIKFGFSVGDGYKELEYKELTFIEPKSNDEEYNQIGTISPEPMGKKKKASGCAFVLTIIGAITTSISAFLYL